MRATRGAAVVIIETWCLDLIRLANKFYRTFMHGRTISHVSYPLIGNGPGCPVPLPYGTH